jgi:hypothetical protein
VIVIELPAELVVAELNTGAPASGATVELFVAAVGGSERASTPVDEF